MSEFKNVLVIGGTGMIGRPVVERLIEADYNVAVGSRSEASARRVFGDRAPVRRIDLTDLSSTEKAIEGFDALHVNLPSGPRFEDCFHNEFRGMKTLAASAAKAGIKRISYLSGATVSDEASFPPARAKWLAETALRACGVPFTIWRATWFMESLDKLYRFGIYVRPGQGATKVHWLAGLDLGTYVAKSFQSAHAADKTFYPLGPEPISLRDAIQIHRNLRHRLSPVAPMPVRAMITLGDLTRNWEMWFGAQMIQHLEHDPEPGDAGELRDLLGEPGITLEQFAETS